MPIKAKIRFWFFYKNPIRGKFFKKWDILFTHCVSCGKRIRVSKKYIRHNRFGDEFLYCDECHQRAIEKAKQRRGDFKK